VKAMSRLFAYEVRQAVFIRAMKGGRSDSCSRECRT
jgi:hypothetical protein